MLTCKQKLYWRKKRGPNASRRCAAGFLRVILWPTTLAPKTPPSITAKGTPAGTGKIHMKKSLGVDRGSFYF